MQNDQHAEAAPAFPASVMTAMHLDEPSLEGCTCPREEFCGLPGDASCTAEDAPQIESQGEAEGGVVAQHRVSWWWRHTSRARMDLAHLRSSPC